MSVSYDSILGVFDDSLEVGYFVECASVRVGQDLTV